MDGFWTVNVNAFDTAGKGAGKPDRPVGRVIVIVQGRGFRLAAGACMCPWHASTRINTARAVRAAAGAGQCGRRERSLRGLLPHWFASRSSVLLSVSLFGPSALRPTMASADFWRCLRGLDPRSTAAYRQISPGIAHPLSRLCASDLRRTVPCKYRAFPILAVSPQRVASIRFLFVAPALCLRLPPGPRSPGQPLPCSSHFPLPGVQRTFTSEWVRPAGRTKQTCQAFEPGTPIFPPSTEISRTAASAARSPCR